jgi:trehalose 6-phosphate phosphatase
VLDGALVHVAGLHGLEHRSGERIERNIDDLTPITAAIADARTLIANGALDADVEDKGAAVALHYRRTPQFADAVRRAAAELAQRHHLSLLEGKMVVELKLGQRTKADAVLDFMSAAPFAGRMPVAVGDDDAFRAAITSGGHAILVGEQRATAARYQLRDTKAVFTWLAAGLTP